MNTFKCTDNSKILILNEKGQGDIYSFNEINSAFTKSLNRLKEIHNISGNALARILKISQQTLNLYENNKRTPNFITAIQISNIFGVTVEDMILDGLDLLEPDLEIISHYPQVIPNSD
ncbi:MAG: helix-turn-helix domain-containing protein [Clostridia bacterium]|nr:helix-turn-helix domain-containing protein [Clostridia bacterium]